MIKYIEEEGMPKYRNPLVNGTMIVKFVVVFPPGRLKDEKVLKQLENLLPPKNTVEVEDHFEEVMLEPLVINNSVKYIFTDIT